MRCRLCLNDLTDEKAVYLFESEINIAKPHVMKMIAKYIFLEIPQDDPISTRICFTCCKHLEDFHEFLTYVEQKQSCLHEFLEVKCDVDVVDMKAYDGCNDVNEALIDINNISEIMPTLVEPIVVAKNEFPCDDDGYSDDGILNETNSQNDDTNSSDDMPLLTVKGNLERHHKEKLSAVGKKKTTKRVTANNLKKRSIQKHLAIKKDARKNGIDRVTNIRKSKIHGRKPKLVKKGTNSLSLKEELNCYERKNITYTNEIISKNVELKCDVCESQLSTFSKLQTHCRETHNTQAFVTCCGQQFTKRFSLLDHIYVHLNPQHYQCKLCEKIYKSRQSLKSHLTNGHAKSEDFKYECSVCGKKFVKIGIFKQHMFGHEAARTFKCQHCDKGFISQHRLNVHTKSLHENITPYVCDFCGEKFKFKPSFDRHVAFHQGFTETPEQCDICGNWLKNKTQLRHHKQNHLLGSVSCTVCDHVSPSYRALQNHIRYTHRKKRDLKCTFCDRAFKVRANLNEHIAMHTGEKHHSCEYCPREFRSKANMYAHVKRDHFQEWQQKKECREKELQDARRKAQEKSNDGNRNITVSNDSKDECINTMEVANTSSSTTDITNGSISNAGIFME